MSERLRSRSRATQCLCRFFFSFSELSESMFKYRYKTKSFLTAALRFMRSVNWNVLNTHALNKDWRKSKTRHSCILPYEKCGQLAASQNVLTAVAPTSAIQTSDAERERVYLPQNNKKTYKIILDISTVAGYRISKPIKLVAYSTNYIKS